MDKIILDTDPERYDGSTHKKCECGNLTEKHYICCKDCKDKKDNERYLKMEFKEWDGKTPLVLFNTDKYFWDESEIDYILKEDKIYMAGLRAILPSVAENEHIKTTKCKSSFFTHTIEFGKEELSKFLSDDFEFMNELREELKLCSAKETAFLQKSVDLTNTKMGKDILTVL